MTSIEPAVRRDPRAGRRARLHVVPSGTAAAGPVADTVPGDQPAHEVPPDLRSRRDDLLRDKADIVASAATPLDRHPNRMTARERILTLVDADSFNELDMFARHRAAGFGMELRRPATDGVVTGWGTIDGRKVAVFAHDARIFGGALGDVFATKIHKLMDLAESVGMPIIGLNDGGGARIQEGVAALAGFGGIFRRNVRASGVIPQISVVLGACAGGSAYSPALTDFTFMVADQSAMFITGPDVIRAVTGEQVTQQDLGGAAVHGTRTGVASFVAATETDCFADVRALLSYLPSNNVEGPPRFASGDRAERRCDALLDLVPVDPKQCYDMRAVIEEIVDDGEFLEVHAGWAKNVLCGFGRLDGESVGIVANQPLVLAGVLDIDASEKAARFIRTCDAFGIPLVTLVDVPGFLPGTEQEHGGIIRRGAKLLYAYCEATVPRIQVVLRKAYGGAYIVMDSKAIGADVCLAWPSNEIAVMGAEAAADIIFRREIAAATDPQRRRAELVADYTDQLMHPYAAAERGLIDDVIDPADTRTALIGALELLRDKRTSRPERRHGNVPL